jgi:hypothetical protein
MTSREKDSTTFRDTLVEDMTSKEEDLNSILVNPCRGYDIKRQGGTIYRTTLVEDMTSREKDLTIFRATLVEDMTSKEEDLNSISINPCGGYDIKRRGFGRYFEQGLTIFRATLVEDMTSREWDVSYMYGNLAAADRISDK